ncbi:hypothetical protein S83_064099 [Arachis hypogaea]
MVLGHTDGGRLIFSLSAVSSFFLTPLFLVTFVQNTVSPLTSFLLLVILYIANIFAPIILPTNNNTSYWLDNRHLNYCGIVPCKCVLPLIGLCSFGYARSQQQSQHYVCDERF